MSNIENDIKRCEKLTEPQNANWIGISNQMAIAGVLARIKKLEEEKKNKADFVQEYIEVTNLYLNSIPKQRIKDKLETREERLIEGKKTYTNKIRINELHVIKRVLLEEK